MNAPSIDIKDLLVAEASLGLVFGTNLFIGKEPAAINKTVTLFDTSGTNNLGLNKDEVYEYPSVQIRVKDSAYNTAYTLASNIKSKLHGRANELCNGTFYTLIAVASGPFFLDYDGNNNARFILNINLQRR